MNRKILVHTCSVLAISVTLSGCNALPRSGPSSVLIDSGAVVKVTTVDRKVGIDYALIDLSKQTLWNFDDASGVSLQTSFGGSKGGPPDIPLGYGDVVQVSIFEAQSGGLFIPTDAGSRPGNYITLPSQTIDRTGTISVPYAGRIDAAGKLKGQIERDIEGKLSGRAIEPQVVITLVTGRSSEISVLGDVQNPAKLELSAAGERVLDAISEAGGLTGPGIETNIILQRRGVTATASYNTLLKNPQENIYLAPHDTIVVDREHRTFVAFGASGENGRYDFDDAKLTLSDAIAKAGGIKDNQADPAQVLLYRLVDRETLRKMNIDTSRFHDETVPVIFRANMRDPAGYFTTQKFAMRDKDILYISN
jgi:polysaccharide export outer membrane protein